MEKACLVYVICKERREARAIAKSLIERKLIACANMFPIESMYRWEGKMEESKEIVLIAKTKEKNYETIKKEVSKVHSYQTPCIMKIDADANEPYYKWLMGEMQ
jgi:periplasmic divalent cation tolerance protein